jgi:adenosylmethionine-8-amino-7-oxononanoate aminotransferase
MFSLFPTKSLPGSAEPVDGLVLNAYGVEPDILAFAKGVTSGYIPLGGIGLPIVSIRSCATRRRHNAGCTHLRTRLIPSDARSDWRRLRLMKRRILWPLRRRKGKKLLEGVKQLLSLNYVGDVRGMGMLVGSRTRRRQGD